MQEVAVFRLFAAYNRWVNERLYAVCATMPDALRKQARGAFFRSVHGTLNHLLLADRLWLGRFLDTPFEVQALSQELYADFNQLRQERAVTDEAIISLVSNLQPAELVRPLNYMSLARQAPVSLPIGLALTHFFNHQTHHRGQLTTLLSQLGYDYGDIDMIYMPGAKTGFFPIRP